MRKEGNVKASSASLHARTKRFIVDKNDDDDDDNDIVVIELSNEPNIPPECKPLPRSSQDYRSLLTSRATLLPVIL